MLFKNGLPSLISSVAVIFFVGGVSWGKVNGLTMESNGGYNILIAIDDTLEEPGNFGQYIGRVKASLNEFSIALARATNGKFFVNSAELLLPTDWNSTALLASRQSMASSDILLSGKDTLPFVDNPHACGLPGNQIQLPYTFFNSSTGDVYGESRKALLTLWARFRWGVYEEHGFPGNLRFPYFYLGKQPDLWKETSCSNVPLLGKYKNLNGEECLVDQADRPDEDCRFLPTPQNAASASLMGFHWLESITDFCDESNHNQEAPNRQNLFCNHRSIWEVIRETADFQAAPVYAAEIPTIRFRTVKHFPTPTRPIFILLDRGGLDEHSVSIIVQVMPGIANFLDNLRDHFLVSLAEYPGDRYDQIRKIVPWNTLGENRQEMFEQIGTVEFGGADDRDSTSAILRAIWEIEKIQFATGAALVVVKAGTYLSFSNPAILKKANVQHEESIYMALAKNRIKLYAAEVTNPEEGDAFIPPTLKRLAERTGGGYADLANPQDVAEKIRSFTQKLAEDVLVPANPEDAVEILSQKFELKHSEEVLVDLRKRSTVSIQLSIPKRAKAVLTIEGPQNPMVHIADEWVMPYDYLRETHTYIHAFNEADEELSLRFTCTAIPDDYCDVDSGFLIITEKFDENYQDQESNRLKITVSTSAGPLGNFVDFQETPVPFVIYAKVELDGQPVENARVIATPYVGAEESAVGDVELLDNGIGNPDVEAFDGIYSGTYVPLYPGKYTISVRVTSSPETAQETVATGPGKALTSRLLPVDQVDIVYGCGEIGCDTVLFTETVSVTGDLPASLAFLNVGHYPGLNEIEKIMDFVAARSLSDPNQINFRWTSPKVLGNNESAVEFRIYAARDHSDLVGHAMGEIIGAIEGQDIQNPGEIQTYTATITDSSLLYFAVQSFTSTSPLPSGELSTVSRIYTETVPDSERGTNPEQHNAEAPMISARNKTYPNFTAKVSAGGAEGPIWQTIIGIVLIVLSLYWEWGW